MQVPDILKNKTVQLASTAVVALAAGSVGGYFFGKKKATITIVPPTPKQLTLNFDKPIGTVDSVEQTSEGVFVTGTITDPEIRELIQGPLLASSSYSPDTEDEDELITARQWIAERQDRVLHIPMDNEEDDVEPIDIKALTTFPPEALDIPEEPVVVNVFTHDDGDWVFEDELAIRRSDKPYVIHVEEFIEDSMGFKQDTVTYYAGDEVIADSAEVPIYNWEEMMGPLKFGHGSRDKNVVYIRNERMRIEWEVLLHTGSYEQEVQGLEMEREAEDELRHSNAVLKFRSRD